MNSPIDFRYAPLDSQAAFCFPDDPHKSVLDHAGRLLYGHPGWNPAAGIHFFPIVVEFGMSGGEEEPRVAGQLIEAPGTPVVHTRLEWRRAAAELTTFASRRASEGRVDNVILRVEPRTAGRVRAAPRVVLKTREPVKVAIRDGRTLVFTGKQEKLFAVLDAPATLRDNGWCIVLELREQECGPGDAFTRFFRFPQEGQAYERLASGMRDAPALLAETRTFWEEWRPSAAPVSWRLPGPYQDLLEACSRNILQARELRDGRLAFQVGPTLYRDLWVVDGNFILEAARYLGMDAEAQRGLETTWTYQDSEGAVYAAASKAFKEHWKDTAIAMYSLVRQAELAQDWSYFDRMAPNALKAVRFIDSLRERARREDSPNGKLGLLAKGFGDGGLVRCFEYTNTLWTLAGLKAMAGVPRTAAARDEARPLYASLREALVKAAEAEKLRHPEGFDYLHMVLRDDPMWKLPNKWAQPVPQVAQWALSHTIYPGLVFEPSHWIVKGHIALMQSCTREDVPAETAKREGCWPYNAAFVAQVYLWAGLRDWARRTFHGFLNHASPLYCWREEQPLRDSMAAHDLGEMPHNWASAEVIRYLRHMLALEDGGALRLLAGFGGPELAFREPYVISDSPTRFGRLDLALEPQGRGWTLAFRRGQGPAPAEVALPAMLGASLAFRGGEGAATRTDHGRILVDPTARKWSVRWE